MANDDEAEDSAGHVHEGIAVAVIVQNVSLVGCGKFQIPENPGHRIEHKTKHVGCSYYPIGP